MKDEKRQGDDEAVVEAPQGAPATGPRDAPTPIRISPRTRNLLIGAIVVAMVLVIRAAPIILTISLGGGFLALVLSFPVRLLSKVIPRGAAILLTLLTVVALLVLAVFVIVPVLINQLSSLITSIPTLAAEGDRLLRDIIRPLQERGMLSANTDAVIDDLRDSALIRASQIAGGLLGDLLGAVTSIADIAVKAFGIVFVAIYLLFDTWRIKAAYLRLVPADYRRDARVLWDEFGDSLSRYLGGLTISLLAQGVLSGLALWLLGVPYALLLGVWVSATAVIPYLGAFLGAIPAILLGFFESPATGLLTIVLYIVIQQLESNVLTPRIQGQAVRVHPIIVLLAVLAASAIDGLRGAIFAVPTLAVLRVLLDFLSVRLRVQS
ncbi:MAG TPA: AI-2E family transporter [Nitrolancea sp.]|nr:AI-2E family transporter [Nitrolancea sp.]